MHLALFSADELQYPKLVGDKENVNENEDEEDEEKDKDEDEDGENQAEEVKTSKAEEQPKTLIGGVLDILAGIWQK